MVGHVAAPPDAGLREVLVARARASSDGRLVADVAGGLVAVVAVALWHPRAWLPLCAAGLCFAAFGAWGICDRQLGELGPDRPRSLGRVLRAARGGAAIVGALAAALLLVEVLALALGTWIS